MNSHVDSYWLLYCLSHLTGILQYCKGEESYKNPVTTVRIPLLQMHSHFLAAKIYYVVWYSEYTYTACPSPKVSAYLSRLYSNSQYGKITQPVTVLPGQHTKVLYVTCQHFGDSETKEFLVHLWCLLHIPRTFWETSSSHTSLLPNGRDSRRRDSRLNRAWAGESKIHWWIKKLAPEINRRHELTYKTLINTF